MSSLQRRARFQMASEAQTERLQMRIPTSLLKAVDDWRRKQDDLPSRSDAIRRLVELGLTVKQRPKRTSESLKARAKELAGRAIDKMAKPSASPVDKTRRKRRLLKGPEEFLETRVDRSTKKR